MRNQDKGLKALVTVVLLMAPWAMANAQASYVLPQLAFGGGWYTALYFTNQNDTDVSLAVSFFNDAAQPLYVQAAGRTCIPPVETFGGCPVQAVDVPAHGTAVVEMLNTGDLAEGYATFFLPINVVGYGVFRHSVSGYPDQEAVIPFSDMTATTNTLVFDETSYTTSIAIVNPSSVATLVAIKALDEQGNTLGTSSVQLSAYHKTEAALKSLKGLFGIVGHRGSAQFTASSGGNVSVLGLRFDGSGSTSAFTSIPVTSDAPPVLPGGGSAPFTSLHINSQFQPTGPIQTVSFTITPGGSNGTYTATFPEGVTLVNGTATSQLGNTVTLTFNTLQHTANSWYAPSIMVYPVISSASLVLNVTAVATDPSTGITLGNASGLLTVTGMRIDGQITSLAGPIFGTFVKPGSIQPQ